MTDFTVNTVADETFDGGDLAAETADGGGLSLREALALANANADADAIGFDAALAGQTLVLTNGELAISQDVSISGDTNNDHKADITISGNDASRIFKISGGDVALASLTLADGAATGLGLAGQGGAIFSASGTTLSIQDSTIRDSSARQGGGILSVSSNTIITNSLLTGNTSTTGGGGFFLQGTSASLVNTTFYGNTGGTYGGAIALSKDLTLNIISSTITGNSAGTTGGGIDTFTNDIVNITNSVIAGNTGSGGDINETAATTLTATNSIFGSDVADVTGGSNGNLENVTDLGLGELLDNGGTVLTLAALDGSILIGAGSNALLTADIYDVDHDGDTTELLPIDARGEARVFDGTIDVGAVEHLLDDTIAGTAANNRIFGGSGDDILSGLDGNDLIFGSSGSDFIAGDDGADRLSGGSSNDRLRGGHGRDLIAGNAGADQMRGGSGADTFVFLSAVDLGQAPGSRDVIVDFQQGLDRIDLSAIDADGAGELGAFDFIGETAFTNVAGQLRQDSAGSTVFIAGDIDGDGTAEFTIALLNVTGLILADSDFAL